MSLFDETLKNLQNKLFNESVEIPTDYNKMPVADIIRLVRNPVISESENRELTFVLRENLEIVEELFGGLRALGGALKGTAKHVANKAVDAGRAIGAAGQRAYDATKQGVQRAGGNIRDIYQAGQASSEAGKKAKVQARNLSNAADIMGQLMEMITSAQADGYFQLAPGRKLGMMSLFEIKKKLELALQTAQANAAQAQANAQNRAQQGIFA